MTIFPINTIESVYSIELPHYAEPNGDLVVMEGSVHVPFAIARVFVVRAQENAVRGHHAHKLCSQFLICASGSVEVVCTDGINSMMFELNHPKAGLYIPPSIWAEQRYKSNDAALTVLCDRGYEDEDYIREYSKYLLYREKLIIRGNFGVDNEL